MKTAVVRRMDLARRRTKSGGERADRAERWDMKREEERRAQFQTDNTNVRSSVQQVQLDMNQMEFRKNVQQRTKDMLQRISGGIVIMSIAGADLWMDAEQPKSCTRSNR